MTAIEAKVVTDWVTRPDGSKLLLVAGKACGGICDTGCHIVDPARTPHTPEEAVDLLLTLTNPTAAELIVQVTGVSTSVMAFVLRTCLIEVLKAGRS